MPFSVKRRHLYSAQRSDEEAEMFDAAAFPALKLILVPLDGDLDLCNDIEDDIFTLRFIVLITGLG